MVRPAIYEMHYLGSARIWIFEFAILVYEISIWIELNIVQCKEIGQLRSRVGYYVDL